MQNNSSSPFAFLLQTKTHTAATAVSHYEKGLREIVSS